MLAQTKIASRNQDPSKLSDQERQMQGVGNIMAAVFAVIFYSAPSGLCIYWIFSTLFGIIQQKFNQSQVLGSSQKKKELQTEVVKPSKGGKRRR